MESLSKIQVECRRISKTDIKSDYTTDETKSDRRFEVKFPAYHKED